MWRWLRETREYMRRVLQLLTEIRAFLAVLVLRSTPPGTLRPRTVKEVGAMLNFAVGVPPFPSPSDVVKGELSVVIGENEPIVVDVDEATSEVSHPDFKGDDNVEVRLSYVHVDDAGNRSPESTATFALLDTIAPPQPGELGVRVIDETFV